MICKHCEKNYYSHNQKSKFCSNPCRALSKANRNVVLVIEEVEKPVQKWLINYKRYGDIQRYKIVKDKFWQQAQRFLYKPNTGNIIKTFPIKTSYLGEEILFQRFREDLETRLDLPEWYEQYKRV